MKIIQGNLEDAHKVIKKVAKELRDANREIWTESELTKNNLFKNINNSNVFTAYINNNLAGAMFLQWEDEYWPMIPPYKSGFIHKLTVLNEFSHKGVGSKLLSFAEGVCLKMNINYLRLDCESKNTRLVKYYTSRDFEITYKKKIDIFDLTLFEKRLNYIWIFKQIKLKF